MLYQEKHGGIKMDVDKKPIRLTHEQVKEKLYEIVSQLGYSRQEIEDKLHLTPYIIFSSSELPVYEADRLFTHTPIILEGFD